MKWNKYTIETTTAAEDYLSSALMDLDIEGVQIEDNVPLTKEDQAEEVVNPGEAVLTNLHLVFEHGDRAF